MEKGNSGIDFAFKGTNQRKIYNNNCSIANWCKSSTSFVFEMNSVQNSVEYLIINISYLAITQFFQNIIGISVEPDPL